PSSAKELFVKVKTIHGKNKVRIIAELKKSVTTKAYSLRPNKMYGHRLVIDLYEKELEKNQAAKVEAVDAAKKMPVNNADLKKSGQTQASNDELKTSNALIDKIVKDPRKSSGKSDKAKAAEPPASKAEPKSAQAVADKAERPVSVTGKNKHIIVAIDAGHGGDDPGAHGAKGTEEKKVVFAIAQKLAALINAQPGMKAVMVRKGDYYVDLRKRMKIARAANADLFVSIHADAFQNAGVSGASVFTLSNKGATSEAARWLANSENASDLVGGVSLDDKDDVLASVLLDLSQSATQEASVNVARKVLKNFENIGELHYKAVQKAGFLVLKSPDIPSILVETAFISNPDEELKLVNPAHQSVIAKAIFKGIRSYFNQVSPETTRVAALNL
ncbi:MAG: N-acetylmuramoyl-L-alanine amidase, partial [Methylococcales bacterium]